MYLNKESSSNNEMAFTNYQENEMLLEIERDRRSLSTCNCIELSFVFDR